MSLGTLPMCRLNDLPDFPGWSAPVSASFLARHSSINLLSLRNFHRCESSGRLVLCCCDTTGKLTILSTCCTRGIFMVFWASESRAAVTQNDNSFVGLLVLSPSVVHASLWAWIHLPGCWI